MVPKPGKDKRLAKNHRPISLLPCLGKVFERIIAKRLSSYMENKNLYCPYQSGFRKGHMSSEQLLRLVEETSNGIKQRKITAALFLDAEAAFDKAWQDGIRFKLCELNLPQRITRLISSFLESRTLKVKVGKEISRTIKMEAGTPQGSSLSPLLYLILVNDIPKEVTNTASLSQFADDTAIWSKANTFHGAVSQLQKSLNFLEGWCRRWRLKLNGSKSKLLIIHRKKLSQPDDLGLLLGNDIVYPSRSAKFLGLDIDDKLNFNLHFDEKARKALARLNLFRILSYRGVENAILIRLYKTFVRPLFEYGCIATIATGKPNVKKLQRVQNEFIRTCLKLPRYLSINLLHEAAGLDMVDLRLKSLAKRHLKKIESHDNIKSLIECRRSSVDSVRVEFKSPLDVLT